MKKKFTVLFSSVLVVGFVLTAAPAVFSKTKTDKAAPEAPAVATGPAMAATCSGCHGGQGVSVNDLWPNLAGQKKDYLSKQLRAFKSQERVDPMMNPLASTLTEVQIEELATYYSGLKVGI